MLQHPAYSLKSKHRFKSSTKSSEWVKTSKVEDFIPIVVRWAEEREQKEVRAKVGKLPRLRLDRRQDSLRKLKILLRIEKKYNWPVFFTKSTFEHFSELAEESHEYLEFYFRKYGS